MRGLWGGPPPDYDLTALSAVKLLEPQCSWFTSMYLDVNREHFGSLSFLQRVSLQEQETRCRRDSDVLSPRRTPNWGCPGGENMGHPPSTWEVRPMSEGIPPFFTANTAMLCMAAFAT